MGTKIKLTNEEIKERKRLRWAEYKLKNIEKIKERKALYTANNKNKIKEYDKKRYNEKKEEILEKQKINRDTNKRIYTDEQKLARKLYREINKDKLLAYAKEYNKIKRKEDPIFKLKDNLRSRICEIFRNKNIVKKSKTQVILGCSFDDFKEYLESKFEDWMNWDNKGLYNGTANYGWDIDHKIPLASATTEEDLLKLNHYTNLQPLCSYTNRDVKKDNPNF
jgi:hypothetical protein